MPLDQQILPRMILMSGACLLAIVAGFALYVSWDRYRQNEILRKKAKHSFFAYSKENAAVLAKEKGVVSGLVRFICTQSNITTLRTHRSFFTQGFWKIGTKHFEAVLSKTGLGQRVSLKGFCHARALLCLGGTFGGALVGVVLSNELMLMGSCVGFFMGWNAPFWALRQVALSRKDDLENHLSEMLEVVSLGLRSGLSFDRSFELYHLHFETFIARESASAQQQWRLGLGAREDVLRAMATSYDSLLFSRVVENIIRSLRFGSALSDSFDSSALEARVLHKAQREEEVAKAPVKMLIPVAALILPAMLLLVMGPILLDMMQGF